MVVQVEKLGTTPNNERQLTTVESVGNTAYVPASSRRSHMVRPIISWASPDWL